MTTDMKTSMVTGCGTQGTEGHYRLTNAMMSTDIMADMKTDTTMNKSMTYDLVGGDLKTHLGHKVEVTGTVAAGNMTAGGTKSGRNTTGTAGSGNTTTTGSNSAGSNMDQGLDVLGHARHAAREIRQDDFGELLLCLG